MNFALSFSAFKYSGAQANETDVLVYFVNEKYEELKKSVVMTWWEPYGDDASVVRFAASWSTTEEDLAALEKLL